MLDTNVTYLCKVRTMPEMDDITSRCCDSPDIRTLESNGRQFCKSCRRYLTPAPIARPITTGRVADDDDKPTDEARIKPL